MIRERKFAGVTTHAGPAPELAALALEYADGEHGRYTADQRQRFRAIADRLSNGIATESTDGIRFWADARDGSPFEGPIDYRPDPDPQWVAAEARRQKERDNARARY